MTNWLEDREALAGQYEDAKNLDARIALHEQYSVAERGLRTWQFDQFDLSKSACVLGVGVGPGKLWTANRDRVPDDWAVVLTDFSPGMVEEARTNLGSHEGRTNPRPNESFQFAVSDAAALPFAGGAFDAVTAHHMLYHVPDRGTALEEFRRVLKPGGRLHATTNGENSMQTIFDVVEEVTGERPARVTSFTLENGREQLAAVFDRVELRRYDDALEVTDPDALVAYVLSRNDVDESRAEDLRAAFAERFEDGSLRIEKDVGLFVAETG